MMTEKLKADARRLGYDPDRLESWGYDPSKDYQALGLRYNAALAAGQHDEARQIMEEVGGELAFYVFRQFQKDFG